MNNRMGEQKNTFFGGAAILAAGIAIVKVIGALYKIPLANILDTEGFGYFNNAYVVFNVLLVISTAGLPVALSKSISEANTLGWYNQAQKIYRVAWAAFLILGVLSSSVLFFFAESLMSMQAAPGAVLAVKAMAPTCLFVCIISAYRGYNQGHENMLPTSASQVIEALGKLVIGLALAWYFMQAGGGMEKAAAGAIFGVTVGAACAVVYLVFNMRSHDPARGLRGRDRTDSAKEIFKKLMVIAIPITLTASILPVTTLIDTYQAQNILYEVMGLDPVVLREMAKTDPTVVNPVLGMYGSYQMAVTNFNLPSSFMVALATAIIPAISACWAKRDRMGVGRVTSSSLRVGALLAFPAGIGLCVLAVPIMGMLYPEADHSVADPCMMVLGIASIFVCLVFLCNAILQASGFVRLPVAVMVIGCVTKLLLNNFLVRQPGVGILGVPVGTLVCYMIVSALELFIIWRVIPGVSSYVKIFGKTLAAALTMGAAAWAVSGLMTKLLHGAGLFEVVAAGTGDVLFSRVGYAIITLVTIAVAVIVYAVLVVSLRAITKDDLSLMPKGDEIAAILRIRD